VFGQAQYFDYTVGIDFEMPIGNVENRAITRRTRLQKLQAIAKYKDTIEAVSEDVANAMTDVQSTWLQIRSRRNARFLAEKQLKILNDRINAKAVVISPAFIQTRLQAEEQLADSERSEIAAIVAYNKALSDLEKAKGTILTYNNVHMVEEQWNAPLGYGSGMRWNQQQR
jgi:outer membrane protein TolC